MSSVFRFSVDRWAVWAPELATPQAWLAWAQSGARLAGDAAPQLSRLDPMLRRRCSQLSRMSLEVAGRCLAGETKSIPSVFGSRSGESRTTFALLQMLAAEEALSPMKFGLSVHNSASGLFTIAYQNRAASSAVAAGQQTFVYSLLEAVTRLASGRCEEILLVFGDEQLPQAFLCEQNSGEQPFAFAMLLRRRNGASTDRTVLRLSIESSPEAAALTGTPQGLQFVRWLLSPEPEQIFQGEYLKWTFRKETEVDFITLLQTENGAVAA